MEDELHAHPWVVKVHQEVPGLLHYPGLDRMLGDSEDPDAADAVLDDGQDADLRAIGQGPQEFRPARAVAARCQADASVLEDLPDRGRCQCVPSPASSPWIRRYPHDSFSRASRSTADRTLRCVAGRPERPRRDRRAQRWRTMSRCQRKIVPGVTISRITAR
ncbi:MAG: hypothetical protein WAK28_25635, partial [Trebonia sp.]